jgi:hypothetical protein
MFNGIVGNFVVTGDTLLRFELTEYLDRSGISLPPPDFSKADRNKSFFFKQGDQFAVHIVSITAHKHWLEIFWSCVFLIFLFLL